MSAHEEREQRWIAYFLGESDPSERDRIEAELRDAPEEAERLRLICDGVQRWAGEEVPSSPLQLEDLPSGRLDLRQPRGRRGMAFAWKALPWAAAIAVMFAVSQFSFTVQVGDMTLSWGQQAAEQAPGTAALEARLAELESLTSTTNEMVEAVAVRSLDLESELHETTAELARNQQLESEIRYRDMERLLNLIGSAGGFAPANYAGMLVPPN